MRKFISILIVVCLLAAAMAVNTGAAGQILFQDTFSGEEINTNDWITNGDARFYVQDGRCIIDNAYLLQSTYGDGGDREWNSGICFSVDLSYLDYAADSETYGSGLWWKDYQIAEGAEYYPGDDIGSGTIYTLSVDITNRKVELCADFGEMLPETTTVEGQEVEPIETTMIVGTYNIPDDIDLECDYSNPPTVNLGMRIGSNYISAYLNGEYLFTYNTPATIGNVKPSPILLTNTNKGLIAGYDNFIVATEDYPLFAADTQAATGDASDTSTSAAPTPTESKEPETSVVIKTEVVSSVDGDGNVVTSVVENTEIVTVAPPVADTNPSPSVGGTSTSTGDMAFVVVTVMIVALGTAVVVKKVNVK